jgi:hypothetical protein
MRSSSSLSGLSVLLVAVIIWTVVVNTFSITCVDAFAIINNNQHHHKSVIINNNQQRPFYCGSSSFVLKMADEPLPSEKFLVGETERLLLERQRIREMGLVQELGKTIKKDGWDPIRAAVWAMYSVSNVIFPVMAMTMLATICLNMMGYGYYWDEQTHQLVIDSLEHIRQENIYQSELLRIAAAAASASPPKTAAAAATAMTHHHGWL